MYEPEELDKLFKSCTAEERLWFEFFLMTSMREQEVMHCSSVCNRMTIGEHSDTPSLLQLRDRRRAILMARLFAYGRSRGDAEHG